MTILAEDWGKESFKRREWRGVHKKAEKIKKKRRGGTEEGVY